MKYFPSSRFIITVVFFLFIGSLWFVIFGSEKTHFSGENINGELIVTQNSKVAYKDSDNDGLADWEERLLGTNPFNSDTDGDGISDGREYKTEKNFLKVQLDEYTVGQALNFQGRLAASQIDGRLNVTSALTQEVSLRYGILGQGKELDGATQNQLIDALAADFSQVSSSNPYTTQDIQTRKDESRDSVNVYIYEIIAALSKHPIIYEEDPVALLDDWNTYQDEKSFDVLSNLNASYVALENEVKEITVPRTLAKTHVDLLNIFHNLAKATDDMIHSSQDPVGAMLGAAAYLHHKDKRRATITDLVSYFRINNS